MKKTLVALAALSAVSAYAQSSMSFTGLFDRGYLLVSNSGNSGVVKTVASNSGTTRFEVRGTEDLGAGMKANFFIETDWNPIASATATSSTVTTLGGFANSEAWVNLQTTNGTIKLGAPNNETYVAAASVAQPGFSSGIGSIYSSNFSLHNGAGTGNATGSGSTLTWVNNDGATGGSGARTVRQDNTIKFESNSMDGFKFAIGWAPKNDYVANKVGASTANVTTGNAGTLEYGLRYTNGPLDAMYAATTYDIGTYTNVTSGTNIAAPALATKTALGGQTLTHAVTAANYQILPQLKINIGLFSSKSSSDTVNSSGLSYGATYVAGNTDLMVNYAKLDDKTSLNNDRKLFGLGANYNLSKTIYLYYRYDKINYSTAVAVTGSDQTRNALGFAVKF